jgi:hypothetical protein
VERQKMTKLTAWAAHGTSQLPLPPGYRIERDADLMELRRSNGSLVAVFSVRGAAPAAVVGAAKEDHRGHKRTA